MPGIPAGNGFCVRATSQGATDKQASLRVAFLVKKIEESFVAFEKRYLMRIAIERKPPLQDGPAAALVSNWRKIRQASASVAETSGIFEDQLSGQVAITQRRSAEDIWSGSLIEKISGDLGSFADAPLGWSGSVVVFSGVDVRAVIQK